MRVKNTVEMFERIAFEAALREHPGDSLAADVYRDWLEDHGCTNIGARRIVTRIIREITEQRIADEVQDRVNIDTAYARALRVLLADRCPLRVMSRFKITIETGGIAPLWCLNGHVWVDSAENQYESAPWGRIYEDDARYVPCVDEVRVGALWVKNLFGPVEPLARSRKNG